LHWAITGHTAAELIAARADSSKGNMGLTNWKNAPKGSIRKTDIGYHTYNFFQKEWQIRMNLPELQSPWYVL
jgi:hypothetical protein